MHKLQRLHPGVHVGARFMMDHDIMSFFSNPKHTLTVQFPAHFSMVAEP